MIFYWSYKIITPATWVTFHFCFSAGATSNSSYFGNNDCPDAFNLFSFVKKRTAAQRRREAGAEKHREMNITLGYFPCFFFLLFFLKKQSKTLLLNTPCTISALVENYFNNLQLHKICLQVLYSILQALFVLLFAHVYLQYYIISTKYLIRQLIASVAIKDAETVGAILLSISLILLKAMFVHG